MPQPATPGRPRDAVLAVCPSSRKRSRTADSRNVLTDLPQAAQLESEIVAGVEEGDVSGQSGQELTVVRQKASAQVVAEQIADEATDVIMAGVRYHTAGVVTQ